MGSKKKKLAKSRAVASNCPGDLDDTHKIALPCEAAHNEPKVGSYATGLGPEPELIAAVTNQVATAQRRQRRTSHFNDQFTLRIREQDRTRFDEYAHHYRLSKGEAFKHLLDIAEQSHRGS